MVRYLVYRVRFTTTKGTKRVYIGYTKCLEVREVYHNKKPPAWLKCQNRCSGLKYTILEEDIQDLGIALALEALRSVTPQHATLLLCNAVSARVRRNRTLGL